MKTSNFSKFVGASVLATGLAFLPLTAPSSAQTNNSPDTTTTPSQTVNNDAYEGDRDFDWGWLGLLGLLGLAGLAKRNEPVRYREPDEVGSPTYRS